MKVKTSQNILAYIKMHGQASGEELSRHLEITSRAVRKQLASLLEQGKLNKVGKPPKVFYQLNTRDLSVKDLNIDDRYKSIIEQNYLVITARGERKEGVDGFIYWCLKQKLPLEKTAMEYVKTLKKYESYKEAGLIDGSYKLKSTFDQVFTDKVYYLEFYSIERFGKTRLGQLLLYAKQSQDRRLMAELVKQISPQIHRLLKKFKIQGVCFIPPTVKREVQLMRELERQLNLPLPVIPLLKLKTQVVVPQKTLSKLEDRVENAKQTIVVEDNKPFHTVLVIDDALGSGATINETAKKLKKLDIAQRVIGLAITGSFSGFEVISEV